MTKVGSMISATKNGNDKEQRKAKFVESSRF